MDSSDWRTSVDPIELGSAMSVDSLLEMPLDPPVKVS